MYIGIDLSSGNNIANTSVTVLELTNNNMLKLVSITSGLNDADILDVIDKYKENCVIGIDSPLSTNGDNKCRESDKKLKDSLAEINKFIQNKQEKFKLSSVIPPMSRHMVYLTVRGITLSRSISIGYPEAKIVEVHPRAALFLHFYHSIAVDIQNYKEVNNKHAKLNVINCLSQTISGIEATGNYTDHDIDSIVAAYSAFCWDVGTYAFLFSKTDKFHPYEFSC
ncbi:DUF429 domain-containing protein [Paenibacillus sp. FSL H8-0079]|uniref:DUF429 domain-containing protein n=1 Tax=Paenibacillus sp. FSL H8-0079 TaxID=2921375 RepID=UPI0030EE24A1